MVPGGYLNYKEAHFINYVVIQPLCCTTETNIILSIYCNLKIKLKEKDYLHVPGSHLGETD